MKIISLLDKGQEGQSRLVNPALTCMWMTWSYSLGTGSSGFGPQRLRRALPKMLSLTVAEPQQVVKFQCQANHSSWPLVTE